MTPLKQLFRQPVRLFAIFLLVGMASAFICLSAGVFASAKATLAQIEERYVHWCPNNGDSRRGNRVQRANAPP